MSMSTLVSSIKCIEASNEKERNNNEVIEIDMRGREMQKQTYPPQLPHQTCVTLNTKSWALVSGKSPNVTLGLAQGALMGGSLTAK